ncbi:MAG: hypothetical protein R2847_02090 [Bacteroidia bacterium]
MEFAPAVYAIAVGRSSPTLPDAPDIAPQFKNSEGFKVGYQKHKRKSIENTGFYLRYDRICN